MKIVIVNGAECCGKSEYILSFTDEFLDDKATDWYDFLRAVQHELMVSPKNKTIYLECAINNRYFLAQLLNVIGAYQDWAKEIVEVELVFKGATRNDIEKRLKEKYDCNESLLKNRVEYTIQIRNEIAKTMASVEYYQYPMKFID